MSTNYTLLTTRLSQTVEAGTFAIAATVTHGDLTLHGAHERHLDALLAVLRDTGATVDCAAGTIRVKGNGRPRRQISPLIHFLAFPPICRHNLWR